MALFALLCDGRECGGHVDGRCNYQRPELFHGVIAQVPFVDVVQRCLMNQFLLPLVSLKSGVTAGSAILRVHEKLQPV